MTTLVRLLPKYGLERFPYLICSLHVLMLLPKNIVHASKHVTAGFVIGMNPTIISFSYSTRSRGGKIGPARWASPVHLELGLGWAIKLLARKKPCQIWPDSVWLDPARPGLIFFAFKRLFGPTSPVFRGAELLKFWPKKSGPILARPGFGPAHCWPCPAQPGPPDCQL